MVNSEFEEDRKSPAFAQVKSVTRLPGKHRVYDIQVQERHRFYAAGLLVHNCIGKYHPHGDQSTYGAAVTLANTAPPLVDGQGNWGTPTNSEAAMRYTEAKMSKFADLFILDPTYLKVVPKVPNFSDDDVIPVYLPALLPYLLFIGNPPTPAYGVSTGNPSFSFKSVSQLTLMALRGEKLNYKVMAKVLRPLHSFGCNWVPDRDALRACMKDGKGSLKYTAVMTPDRKAKTILIQSFLPGSLSSQKSVDSTLVKLASLEGVRRAYSKQGKKSKGSGPYGALFVVETKGLKDKEWDTLVSRVTSLVTSSVSVRLGVTIRRKEKPNLFRYMNFVEFMEKWTTYRVVLEVKVINYLSKKVQEDLHRHEVYLFAVNNMEKLLKVLPKVLTSKDPDSALAKALTMPVQDAKIILDRQVRQLAKLEASELETKIKSYRTELKGLAKDLKNPGERAARVTEEKIKQYLKKPDRLQSGLDLT